MKEYNINDTVWIAQSGQKEVRHDCPVCYGQLFVTLILGNGDEIRTPCDYCGKGYEGPKGYVLEYEWVAEPRQVTITDKTKKEYDGKIEFDYISYDDAYFHEAYDTKEEAEAKTLENIKEHEEQQRKNIEWRKSHNHKSYSWHVGYSLKEVKEAKRKLDWHEKRVIFMGKRAKPAKNKPAEPLVDEF